MKLDETKLQEIVEKIAYEQFGQEQIDDLCVKIGMLNEYVQEQLRLYAVVWQSEQLLEEQSNWLMANTSLEVEKIVDFKEHFK